jgi:trimeric autotransporter adhesin
MRAFVQLCGSFLFAGLAAAESPPGYVVYWGIDTMGRASGNLKEQFVPTGKPRQSEYGLVKINGQVLDDAAQIAIGGTLNLVLRKDGTVVGWGYNKAGQAVGAPEAQRNFVGGLVRINGKPLERITAIAAGSAYSLALRDDGTVVGWGDEEQGSMRVPEGLTDVIAIASASHQNMAVKRDGTLVGWGSTWEDTGPKGLTNVIAVSAYPELQIHNLALRADGTLLRWRNPDVPAGLSNVVAVAAGSVHCLALTSEGRVIGWGGNSRGEATPPASLTNAVAISAGEEHSLALTRDGLVVAWGDNRWDHLQPPPGLSNVVAIGAGKAYSLAITTNPAVAANFQRKGGVAHPSLPVPVQGDCEP